MTTRNFKTYSHLMLLNSFEERFEYLRLVGQVGAATFGYDRYLNQMLYRDRRWKSARDKAIIRDNGNDLGIEGYPLISGITVHHITPLLPEDIENMAPICFDLNNLISTSGMTHKAIHYGDASLLAKKPIVRVTGDTCPWL